MHLSRTPRTRGATNQLNVAALSSLFDECLLAFSLSLSLAISLSLSLYLPILLFLFLSLTQPACQTLRFRATLAFQLPTAVSHMKGDIVAERLVIATELKSVRAAKKKKT